MKKLAISLILAASLIVTPSAFALKAMSDSTMKEATGQAGVTIALDDVTIYQSSNNASTTYTDEDGLGDGRTAGIQVKSVGKEESITTVRAIYGGAVANADDQGNRGGFLSRSYDDIMAGNTAEFAGYSRTGNAISLDPNAAAPTITAIAASPIKIDVVGRVKALSVGMAFNHRNDAANALLAVQGAQTAYSLADIDDVTSAQVEAVLQTPAGGGYSAAQAAAMAPQVHQLGLAFNESAITDSFQYMRNAINVAGIVIQLPTLEIRKHGTESVKEITLLAPSTGTGTTTRPAANNDGKQFIVSKKYGDSLIAVLGGYVEVCAH